MRISDWSSDVCSSDLAHVAAQGATPGIAGIMAAIEEAGFACEVQERHPDRFVQVADCRSNQDKYRKLIASEWKDPVARDAMYQGRMPGMCGTLGLKDQVRWAASGNWALVAGGDKIGRAHVCTPVTNA